MYTHAYPVSLSLSLSLSVHTRQARDLNPLSANYPGTTAKHPLEGLPELWWEYSVYHRVQGAVEIAQPQEDACYELRWLAGLASGAEQRNNEERQPTRDERPGDYRQRFRGFLLALRLDSVARPLARRMGRVAARRIRHCRGGGGGRGRRDGRRGDRGRLGRVRPVVRRWFLRRDRRMIRRGSRYRERCRFLPRSAKCCNELLTQMLIIRGDGENPFFQRAWKLFNEWDFETHDDYF